MGQPQQRRLAPLSTSCQVRQAAVIKAAAHAQSTSGVIESHQRQQHQVQGPDLALPGDVLARFRDTKAVGLHFFAGVNALEHHLGLRPGAQYRQVGRLASTLGRAQQQARVDLAVVGQVKRNVLRAAKQWMLGQLPLEPAGRFPLLGRRQGTTGLAQQASELRARQQRRFCHIEASRGGVITTA